MDSVLQMYRLKLVECILNFMPIVYLNQVSLRKHLRLIQLGLDISGPGGGGGVTPYILYGTDVPLE